MNERKPISKKIRFEVLKRDKFTCQYCGKQSPEVILHLDHIKPVSKGGKNTLLNLVTSCADCNLGKGARELSDESEIEKQKKQLKDLAEKQDQIKLMIKWREQLIDSDELMVESVVKSINSHLVDWSISDSSTGDVRSIISKGKYNQLMDSLVLAKTKYGFVDSSETANKFITIVVSNKKIETDPVKSKINYAKGILRNRLNYFDERKYYILTKFVSNASAAEELIDLAKLVKNWTDFTASIHYMEVEYNG